MPKGQKTDNETIYKVMLSYAVTNNYSETARNLEMPESTVRKIIYNNKDKEEFAKLCEQKKDEFIESADKIIKKGTKLLNKRLDMALEKQEELERLIDSIYDVSDNDMKPKEKLEIAKKISKIQLNNLNEITTAIGTLYDKRALAKGESTENSSFDVNIKVVE